MKLTKYISVAAAALMLTACGDKGLDSYPWLVGSTTEVVKESNIEPDNIEIIERELRGAIPYMINYSHEPTGTWAPHKYQYYRANSIDNYAGYWTVSKGTFAFGGPLPTLYTYPNDYMCGSINPELFTAAKNTILYAKDKFEREDLYAIALLCEAYVGHEMVDFAGSIPFNDWRNGKTESPLNYEKGEDIYKQIFEEIDTARAMLMRTQPSADALSKIEDNDTGKSISRLDWTRWVKFANSLQLRMAMNIVKYDPTLAQQKAEAAVTAPYGVIGTEDQFDLGYYHDTSDCALYFMCNSWHDLRLSASIENIMKHFKNPLLYEWFDSNTYPISDRFTGITTSAGEDVYGVRNGIRFTNLNVTGKDKGGYGAFGVLSGKFRYMHQDFIKRTEMLFIRAEGALRGWNMGGTAQQFYEDGIRLAFRDNGINDDEVINGYINQTNLPVVDYVDPYQSQHNCKGRVSCDVKWNESDSQELKLEKIISQKYIAVFPMGGEAWTTFRRTGYPRLFPVYLNDLPDVDTELQIRRCAYTFNENGALDEESVTSALGGTQNAGTRVFWDLPTEERGEDIEGNGFGVVIPKNF